MNRRDFIRTVGKGVTAATGQSLVPKGVVGSVLKGAMNIAPAVSKAFDLEKELLYFFEPERFLKFTGKWHQATTFEEAQIALNGLRTNYTRIFNTLKAKNPTLGEEKFLKDEYNDIMKYLNGIQDEINLSGGKIFRYSPDSEPDYTNLNQISAGLSYFHEDLMAPIMNQELFDSGLITPEIAANLKQKYGMDVYEYRYTEDSYKDSPGMNAAEIDKWVYDQTAKDIDYSRMDKAGGAEDEGYAKYYEELKQFGSILEEMDRRGFLKMLGKGAAAAAAPKGAIAKALTNLPTGGAPKIDAGKALLNFIDTAYNVRSHPGSLIDKYSLTVNTLSNFLLALKQTGLTTDPQLLYDIKHNIRVDSTILKYLKKELTQQQAFDMLQKYNAVDLLDLDDSIDDFNLQSAIDNYYNILDHMDESLSRTIHQLFQHNLISPEIQSQLENKHNIYKCDYMNDPDSKARRNERRKKEREKNRKDNYNNIAKDINYSRMDKAGGAEDEGYAKYYEELKQFGTLLENMNRRGFLKMLGKGAAAATGQSLVPKGVVGSIMSGVMNPSTANPLTQAIKTVFGKDHINLYIDDKIGLNYVSKLKNAILSLSPIINSVQHTQSSVEILDRILSGKLYGTDLNDYIEDTALGEILHFNIIKNLYKQNLVTPELEKWLFEESIFDPYQLMSLKLNTFGDIEGSKKIRAALDEKYPNWEELSKKKRFEIDPITRKRLDDSDERARERWEETAERVEREEQDQLNKDNLGAIRSRFDYGGGSEDTDYAKYYEKVKTFDQLLSVVKEADDDIISGDTEGIEPGETGMPRGFGHPDRNRNYVATVSLNVIYGVPEDVENAYDTAAGKKLQQFVKQQLPWLNEYSQHDDIFNPKLTFSGISSALQSIHDQFKSWVESEDYDKNVSHYVQYKELAMYFLQQYPDAFQNFSKVFKYIDFLYGDSPSNPENVSNYPLNVSLYDTTRELGGHEEGGWWYNVDRFVGSIPASNFKQAEAAAKKIYNNLNKVNIDGKPTIILEKYKGSIDTTNRPKPRYE